MWKKTYGFIQRHKKKIFIASSIVGGILIVRKYVGTKITEWESRQTQDFLEQMKRHHHFEGTLQTCDSTLLGLVPKTRDTVRNALNVSDLIHQLKSKPKNKLQIWEELKVLVFCEAISEICGEALLFLFLRVQLSIIGGYMYIDTQASKNGTIVEGLCTPEIQQRYLACVHYFFNNGMKEVVRTVRDTVQLSIANLNLKDNFQLKDYQELFDGIKKALLSNKFGLLTNVSSYLFSDDALDLSVFALNPDDVSQSVYQKMLLETRDVLESQDFAKVFKLSLDQGLALLIDRLSECYTHVNKASDTFVNPHCLSIPLAKVIPVLHTVMHQHEPAEQESFVNQLIQLEMGKSFAANVYEAFSQHFDIDHNIRSVSSEQ